eukprot:TRINITY_DN41754_c0_g1_i1.p1 TRINITY_DN41754_c0_g1~~TRINITY_DN41754_c0_g1_i1.p1  ORF type:complete len:916 (+),score=147.29 TRINITY_DN41754_c0_g1_i1:65-2812(+)
MVSTLKAFMYLAMGACALTFFLSFSHTHHLLSSATPASSQHALGAATVDSALMSRLTEFPNSMKDLERRLLGLERGIQDFDLEKKGQSRSATDDSKSESVPRQSVPSLEGPGAPYQARWRTDSKCGKNTAPLPDGKPAECNPEGDMPCCSHLGWCGNSPAHCGCKGCVDYRVAKAATTLAAKVPAAAPLSHSPVPKKDGHEGKTVVVIIPFRDREGHLVLFKKYWRWFAQQGINPTKIRRWEIFVMEQFDSQTFNRGWNFNTGVAIASAQQGAAQEITSSMGIDFDCAVIQDIDYLPEKGVDYSECEVPMQLSAEIDRYNWKTPYLKSAGGIVGMNLKHWRKINGFGNNYFGWGGEDDELHHRLRLNGLLYGDCYPYCNKGDSNIGKPGQSIKRPARGFGRFSGKFMHSANHTKRITDSKAYAKNIEQLQEIEKGGSRWKTDGLNSLAFHIVDHDEDTTDAAKYGITYHHVRVHRGKSSFDVRSVILAVPPGFCEHEGGSARPKGWVLRKLGTGTIPWDVKSLRARAASFAGSDGALCPGAESASFLLIDRRRQLSKIFSESEPRLLLIFLRSLQDPAQDALIVADPRPADKLQAAFVEANAFVDPPTDWSVCTSALKVGGVKYSVHQGGHCGGGGWDAVKGGTWQAFAKQRPGTEAYTFCDNEKHWTQKIVKGTECPKQWANLKWVSGGTFWAREGAEYCIGSRQGSNEELSFSRLLPQKNCGESDFKHDFTFRSVEKEPLRIPGFAICVGRDNSGKVRVSSKNDCNQDNFLEAGRFAARASAAAAETDKIYCVASTPDGDVMREQGKCGGRDKFEFAIPAGLPVAELEHVEPTELVRTEICYGFNKGDKLIAGIGEECKSLRSISVRVHTPSLLDIAASTLKVAAVGSQPAPMFTLVEEEISCFGFLCPNVLL